MQLYLSSSKPEVMERAQTYLKDHLEDGVCKIKKEHGADRAQYTISLPYARAEDLLNQLLALSPDLDISGTIFYDLDDRDASFWGSTRYQSAVDSDGKRYFRVSSSTGWA